MTQIVHIANTNVELELSHSCGQTLEKSLSLHPLCLQLQFLPLLYAQPEDEIVVTALPSQDELMAFQQTHWIVHPLPQLVLLKETQSFIGKRCLSWGYSRQVKEWCDARQMMYSLPKWQTVQTINSKAFSFRYNCLEEASLIYDEQALLDWLRRIQGPKVLKTCFGLSGTGHWHIEENFASKEVLLFCYKEWQQKRPIIAEPWLNRVEDFSTQWFIHSNQDIEYLGATRFETNEYGIYQATLTGPEKIIFASFESLLQQHRSFVLKALQEIAAMGFFGFIGIDALLYRHPQNQSICLYPLVEINARQTMSLMALRLQQRVCPSQILRLAFQPKSSSSFSLLPRQLVNAKGKIVHFQKELTATILPTNNETIH